MNLTRLSVERPVFAWMLMLSFILFGAISFFRLGISRLPDVDFPIINVSVSFSGASPEVMESDIVDVIENAVMGAEGLKEVTSSARYGSASITLEFDMDRNIDLAFQEVQAKVSQAMRRLPEDVEPPVVTKSNPEDQPIMWIALSGDASPREIMAYARDKIINQFQLVPGVGDVFLGGYLEPNVRIWINREKLRQYELSVDDVIGAIQREHIEVPAGLLQQNDKEYTLRVVGESRSPEEISKVVISRRGGGVIYTPLQIKDVARVELGTEDVRRRSRVLGENAIGIGIRKQRGTNAVQVADGVKAKMAEIEASLPKGYKLGINSDTTKFIKESVHELQFELILSALLTGIVCWLFLGSLRSTFNILLAIPTSLIGVFAAIDYFGFTLNTFTFLGLILAVGIVVDDAIMVLENIVRHKEMGKTKREAALEGTHQIAFAALATTIAIIAIFLPVAFMEGVIGKFFYQFGVTISIAVAISLIEALTLTPMRCSQFMDEGHSKTPLDKPVEWMTLQYRKGLEIATAHPWKVITVSFLIFVAGLSLVGGIRKEFTPSQDQSLFLARLSTKIGSSIDKTDSLVQQAEEKLKKYPQVSRFFVAIGGFGGGQVNTATMFITLVEPKDRKESQLEMMALIRKDLSEIKGLRVSLQDLSQAGFSGSRGFPIEFSIRGPDWDKLVEVSKMAEEKLKQDPQFVDVDTNYDEGAPEVRIIPKRDRAAQLGVSVQDVARTIGYLVGGDRVARLTESGKRIDVRIRLDSADIEDPKTILQLMVRNNRGELIRLSEVADIEVKSSLVSITREQRERAIKLFSNVAPGASQADLLKKVEALKSSMPPGYTLVLGGSSRSFGETFKSLQFALWLGVVVAYMILASQFNSFVHGFTVLLSLPFSLTGAWMALRLADASLNIYSMIGLILLMGIVKKNAIMLVDFANQKREEGATPLAAMIEAGPVRLRPILMTSITIVTAALPPIFELGPGYETRAPMSLAVVGGVTISTLFTLFVVPCAYILLSRFERKSS